MTLIERERAAALARKANAIRDAWLREREEALAAQHSANSEIRRNWKESDGKVEPTSVRMPADLRKEQG